MNEPLQKSVFGTELATKVGEYLKRYGSISNSHRDYCGVGFCIEKGMVIYTHFYDGDPDIVSAEETQVPNTSARGIIFSFGSLEEFTSWLSLQSDISLSGNESHDPWYRNNQRITKERLLNVLSKCT